MRRLIPGLLLLATVATGAAGCNEDPTLTNPTPNPTTQNPAATITEPPFTGTLRANGAATYPFSATTGGTITATLTALSPNNPIGLSIGTWTGSACQIVIANDNASQAASVTGTVTAAAALCVRVYDQGKLTAPVDFTVTIVHP